MTPETLAARRCSRYRHRRHAGYRAGGGAELLEFGASVVTVGRDLDDLDLASRPARDAGRLT